MQATVPNNRIRLLQIRSLLRVASKRRECQIEQPPEEPLLYAVNSKHDLTARRNLPCAGEDSGRLPPKRVGDRSKGRWRQPDSRCEHFESCLPEAARLALWFAWVEWFRSPTIPKSLPENDILLTNIGLPFLRLTILAQSVVLETRRYFPVEAVDKVENRSIYFCSSTSPDGHDSGPQVLCDPDPKTGAIALPTEVRCI
jgi:hypothetical protein